LISGDVLAVRVCVVWRYLLGWVDVRRAATDNAAMPKTPPICDFVLMRICISP